MNYDVILATYNGEKYVVEQLDSIINQTVKPANIYIRDDGSQDKTVEIIKNYILNAETNEPEINIEFKDDGLNVGYIKNFEKLVGFAVSEFVFFSDQDDIWIVNKAECLLNKLKDDSVSVVFSDAYLVNNNKEILGTLWGYVNYLPATNSITIDKILINNVVTGATLACRRSFLINLLPFPALVPHDHWISSNAVIKNCLNFCEEKLILYRQHENNQIGASKTSIKAKVKGVFNRAKMNKRISYYIQIHELIENLVSRGILSADCKVSSGMRNFITYMDVIYKGKIKRDISFNHPKNNVLGVFFKKDYLINKTKKVVATDLLDSFLIRTIFKK